MGGGGRVVGAYLGDCVEKLRTEDRQSSIMPLVHVESYYSV